jgi:AcrR family transcriptional regulator
VFSRLIIDNPPPYVLHSYLNIVRKENTYKAVSIKQRREREKQEIRQAILSAARQIALQDGWQAVTIRRVADRIEYSPPTIYEYFASKEDILLELYMEGFRQLAVTLQVARDSVQDHQERLLNMADAYWDFAMEHLELYQVMYGMGGVPFDCRGKWSTTCETFLAIHDALDDWTQAGGIDIPDLQGALTIMRSLIHGLISLTMIDRINGGAPEAKKLLRRAVSDLLVSWSMAKKG